MHADQTCPLPFDMHMRPVTWGPGSSHLTCSQLAAFPHEPLHIRIPFPDLDSIDVIHIKGRALVMT